MTQARDRFVHQGRPLAEWLLQLIDADPARRQAAAEVITTRFFLALDQMEPGDFDDAKESQDLFASEVRRAVNAPDFPAADFVQRLLSLDLALHESWMETIREQLERDRQHDRHEVTTTGPALGWVIGSLGKELLPAADLLRVMMETRVKQHMAFDAIGRMGRDGLAFYDELKGKLDAEGSYHKEARALGALLQGAPEKIPEILELAVGPDGGVRINAIHALGCCGRGSTEVFALVETRLRDQLVRCEEPVEWHALASALGHMAQSVETARALLPFLNQTDKQGTVIDALGRIGEDPETVVPRLIECLDTFEEYDSDYCYHGEHERVTQALRGFGLAAAAAVPSLIQHVWTRPQQYWSNGTLAERPEPDQGVIELLGELGPAAQDALPTLLEVQAQMRTQSNEGSEPGAESAIPQETYVELAIKRITSPALLDAPFRRGPGG
jgi:hypothetical protein